MKKLVMLATITILATAKIVLAQTADDVIALVKEQFAVSDETARGTMNVFLKINEEEHLIRSYPFVLGKWWEDANKTEWVRIDFESPINSGLDNSSLYSNQRYLLKRSQDGQGQWLYTPSLRRVRIIPYRADSPLLQSDYLFYDLTPIMDFGDYTYKFLDSDPEAPIIEGIPANNLVPYQKTIFILERKGEAYRIVELRHFQGHKERRAHFSEFVEVKPNHYRPQRVEVTSPTGRTEMTLKSWAFRVLQPELFTITQLEIASLPIPQ